MYIHIYLCVFKSMCIYVYNNVRPTIMHICNYIHTYTSILVGVFFFVELLSQECVTVSPQVFEEGMSDTATCCNTLQHTATHCNTHALACHPSSFLKEIRLTLYHTAPQCNTLQHAATHCNTHALMSPSSFSRGGCLTLHLPAPHCTTLHHTAPHCNTLQHASTHCNTHALSHLSQVFSRGPI